MAVLAFLSNKIIHRKPLELISFTFELFYFSSGRHFSSGQKPSFGLLFDIDGVIVRGKKVLPSVPESFRRLVDKDGKFRVPTVFVTNAGNALRSRKAQQLSTWLGININEDQVVMAHSPLRMFQQYHDKHMLISGQGPIKEIAKYLGFNKVTTIEELRNTFPVLDAVDHQRRVSVLLIDILMTNGLPNKPFTSVVYPHIPVLACNMDLQWMAEACMPRFGHGAFLLCLEALYKKLTGQDLIYTALIGKPSEITYHHAHHMVINQAKQLNIHQQLKRLYAIGDNINTDVFGANLYQQYLRKQPMMGTKRVAQTGVYSQDRSDSRLDHSPRDFLPVEEKLREPNFTVQNVSKAIDLIFEEEQFE
ncbi:hypothetical protein B566_EDAN010515 [Ephemera danica]|nr:hypothetical protein B566_EDAN010515 [Ephemera danica]